MGTTVAGDGLAAMINSDGSVVLTDQSNGQNWTFNAANELVSQAGPGTPAITYAYRTVSGRQAPVLASMSVPVMGWKWSWFYGGDAQCQDVQLPAGFSKAPSGYACDVQEPSGDNIVIQYTQPSGASVPRISRVVQQPSACGSWQSCGTSQLAVFDLGWDNNNRLTYQRQDASVDAAVLGNINPADHDYWVTQSFDSLNRISTTVQPLFKSGAGDSGQVGGTTQTTTYQAADTQWAPANHELVMTSSTPGGPTQTKTVAFDDAGRQQFSQDIDGVVTSQLWDPNKSLVYGTVTGSTSNNGPTSVTGYQYDSFGRRTQTVSGAPAVFDLSTCQPNAATSSIGNNSCWPVNSDSNAAITQHTTVFDEPSGTGSGLKSQWFNNSQPSGNPSATAFVNQGGSGFPIAPPAGVKGQNWSASLSGGVRLNAGTPAQPMTWNIGLNVPQGMFSAATLYVGGTVCTVLPAGQSTTSCTFTSNGSTYPITVDLVHAAGGQSSGKAVVTLQQNEFAPPITDNSYFQPAWSASTTATTIDHDSSGNPITNTARFGCSSPISGLPTQETNVGIGAGANAPGLTATATYVPNGFGGSTTSKTTNPSGQSRTTTYWGLTDTPSSLPNASQIPEQYQHVPQERLIKMLSSPAGNQQWSVSVRTGPCPTVKSTYTAAGLTQAETFDNVGYTYSRDAYGRLTQASIKTGDTTVRSLKSRPGRPVPAHCATSTQTCRAHRSRPCPTVW